MTAIREERDAAAASAACAAILDTLPEWFVRPESKARYVRKVGRCTCLIAGPDGADALGLLALRWHYGVTAEIWLLAVRAGYHRHGIGRGLMAAAVAAAKARQCQQLVVSTLSPDSGDPHYAETRKFYAAQGFRPLVPFADGAPGAPSMWFIRPLPDA